MGISEVDVQVENKVVVVTGGGSGIGEAMCRRFAADGARAVVVVDRDEKGAQRVADEVGGLAIVTDVGSERDVEAMVAQVSKEFGQIDVLCNNAGIGSGGNIIETPLDEWQRQWDVNVMAHVYAARAVLPDMLERGEGYLLHTASMAGILTTHGNAPYAVSKHAVVGLAEWLSVTYHDRGIQVFLLAPLGVDTPMLRASGDDFVDSGAVGPVRTAEEVADQVTRAFAEERFLILTDPVAQTWIEQKTNDLERWLKGMRRMQTRMFGGG